MNSNYIIPVSVAAAVHAAVLFGFTKGPRLPTKVTDDSAVIGCILHLPEPELPESIEPEASSRESNDIPDPPRPTNIEPIAIESPTAISMPLPPVAPPRLGGSKIIAPASFDGDGGLGRGDWRKRISLSTELDNSPRTRFQAAPQYPFSAKTAGLSGEVLVEFTVDEGGRVLDPRVVRSTDRMFEEPTLRAVAKWQFEPGRSGGRIVRFRMAVPVVFNLNE